MAEFLCAPAEGGGHHHRSQLGNGTNRSALRPLRRASRACISRWTQTHRRTLLHELRRPPLHQTRQQNLIGTHLRPVITGTQLPHVILSKAKDPLLLFFSVLPEENLLLSLAKSRPSFPNQQDNQARQAKASAVAWNESCREPESQTSYIPSLPLTPTLHHHPLRMPQLPRLR